MKINEYKDEDLNPVNSLKPKDSLAPIWEDDKLKQEIRLSLVKIAESFYNNLDIGGEIDDIVLTGSLANYNWSKKYSDYDLHIILDFDKIEGNESLISKTTNLAKIVWNMRNDIKIEGFPVEIYVERKGEQHISSGVFSLLNNRWIQKPKPIDVELDLELVKDKVVHILEEIDYALEHEWKNIDEQSAAVDKVWDKIKRLRQEGLENGGEFSPGNLVFKVLRRNKYIEKLVIIKRELKNEKLVE